MSSDNNFKIYHTVEDIYLQIEKLKKEKTGMTNYLLLKVEQEDWHGVSDAAMDIREIQAKIVVLEENVSVIMDLLEKAN
jgi:hypothetical protein